MVAEDRRSRPCAVDIARPPDTLLLLRARPLALSAQRSALGPRPAGTTTADRAARTTSTGAAAAGVRAGAAGRGDARGGRFRDSTQRIRRGEHTGHAPSFLPTGPGTTARARDTPAARCAAGAADCVPEPFGAWVARATVSVMSLFRDPHREGGRSHRFPDGFTGRLPTVGLRPAAGGCAHSTRPARPTARGRPATWPPRPRPRTGDADPDGHRSADPAAAEGRAAAAPPGGLRGAACGPGGLSVRACPRTSPRSARRTPAPPPGASSSGWASAHRARCPGRAAGPGTS
ncbi:hypothetical protein SAMN05421870_101836 [Streptomyces qinglanensis]|uniref:Uncharacterized protein n=1 Tax=Streptomyces qinglanensis TaxID=943816 RepID=A0A1H9P1F9_9ACTN|nr:hypothetical protein SAMN05421870_101836 [Streptomyces qinglanensis]